MTTTSPAPRSDDDLALDVSALKSELSSENAEPDSLRSDAEHRAEEYVGRLAALVTDGAPLSLEVGDSVDSLGRELQLRAARQSRMLLAPVKSLAARGADGGPVASALSDLRLQVEALDPNRMDFAPGWPNRFLGFIPAIGTPLRRYFSRYQSAQVVIDDIITSLETGRDQLRRDNATLSDDQREMREVARDLGGEILFAQALDRRLEELVTSRLVGSPEQARRVQEELQFPVRQRIVDLQQQLAVGQQGVLASEIIIRNNRELIRGVDRTITVTVTALRTAVSVAFALAHQQIVLDKVSAVSRTTSYLIAGTAQRLRIQGAEVQTQSASAALDMEQLRAAFTDINAALDEISRFRREALPVMAQTILEFDELTSSADTSIRQLGEAEPPPSARGD